MSKRRLREQQAVTPIVLHVIIRKEHAVKRLLMLKQLIESKIPAVGCMGCNFVLLGFLFAIVWGFYAKNPMDGFGAVAAAASLTTGVALILLCLISWRN